MDKSFKAKKYTFKPCPFCGKDEMQIVSNVLEAHANGKDAPCSQLVQVQAECTYCGARGPRSTVDVVYNSELEATACVAWNEREEDK